MQGSTYELTHARAKVANLHGTSACMHAGLTDIQGLRVWISGLLSLNVGIIKRCRAYVIHFTAASVFCCVLFMFLLVTPSCEVSAMFACHRKFVLYVQNAFIMLLMSCH